MSTTPFLPRPWHFWESNTRGGASTKLVSHRRKFERTGRRQRHDPRLDTAADIESRYTFGGRVTGTLPGMTNDFFWRS